jgi:uncharacterized coiled-coil protein SlyX
LCRYAAADDQMDMLRAKSAMLARESAKEIQSRDARIAELDNAIVAAERKFEQMKMEQEYTMSRMKDSREKAVRDTEKAKDNELRAKEKELSELKAGLFTS